MFKIVWTKNMAIKISNTKSNSVRLRYFELLNDDGGFFIQSRTKKVYLTSKNCLNMIDFKK